MLINLLKELFSFLYCCFYFFTVLSFRLFRLISQESFVILLFGKHHERYKDEDISFSTLFSALKRRLFL